MTISEALLPLIPENKGVKIEVTGQPEAIEFDIAGNFCHSIMTQNLPHMK